MKGAVSTVLVTFPDKNLAIKISKHMLAERMAACANLFPIDSYFWWNGKIEESEEWAGLYKIRTEDFDRVCREIRTMHPYEVPCIVRYDVADGLAEYMGWVKAETAQPSSGSPSR